MTDTIDAGAELAAQLDRALDRGELVAYFQPQYELATERIVALEALCRWTHPEQGIMAPDSFIPVAERYDLIRRLGRYMLEHSGRRALQWAARGVQVGLAINVSPSELDAAFAEGVLHQLDELGLPPSSVTLEIIESPAMSESYEEFETLETLVAGGVGVSIDDFGAGHTSLEGLRRLPFTEVKIDRALTHDLSRETDELVQSCVAIARERGAHVVAEGIETSEHLARARAWGCDRGQGYFFAPPLPAEELDPILIVHRA